MFKRLPDVREAEQTIYRHHNHSGQSSLRERERQRERVIERERGIEIKREK